MPSLLLVPSLLFTCQQDRAGGRREAARGRTKVSVHCPLEPFGLILVLDCLQWAGGGGSGFWLLFRTWRASFQFPGARFLCLLCSFILISVSTSWQRILHLPVWEPGTWN